jgi:hypothetical protein
VKTGVNALKCPFDRGWVGDIAAQKFDLPRQVPSMSTRQIIENAHQVSMPRQCVDEVRAQEASTARHEKAGHPRSLRLSRKQ